jgi:hypothetical protein
MPRPDAYDGQGHLDRWSAGHQGPMEQEIYVGLLRMSSWEGHAKEKRIERSAAPLMELQSHKIPSSPIRRGNTLTALTI